MNGLFGWFLGRDRARPAHDLFYPPERVRRDALFSLRDAGPCDLSELERRTGIAPEFLLDEVLALGARGVVRVERRYSGGLFRRKARETIWVSALEPGRGQGRGQGRGRRSA